MGFYQKQNPLSEYRKIPIISPGLIFLQKAVFAGLFFGGVYFRRGLLSEGILHPKTANGNSPWAYIREGLLSEGYLRLTV